MRRQLEAGRGGVELVSDSADADLVLLCEYGCLSVLDAIHLHYLYGDKLVVFGESDWPLAAAPGLYPSITLSKPWAQSWSYLPDGEISPRSSVACEHLYSFLGRASTHPVRREIVQRLNSTVTPCIDTDSLGESYFDRDRFIDLICRSHFTLCPRGFGVSSIRAFEVMALGRVPVIISDQWVAPEIDGMEGCFIRVAERDVAEIPNILSDFSGRASIMGHQARVFFEEYFSDQVAASSLVPRLIALRQAAGEHGFYKRLASVVDMRSIRNTLPLGSVRERFSRILRSLGVAQG